MTESTGGSGGGTAVRDFSAMSAQSLTEQALAQWHGIKERIPTSDTDLLNDVKRFDQVLNYLNEKV